MKTRGAPHLLPHVAANFAMTWDGRISTRNLTPSDFSSRADKRRMLEIRAWADAILVGRGTLQKENMRLGLPAPALRAERLRRKQAAWPVRVILSNSGRIRPGLRIFRETFSPILIYSTVRMPKTVQTALADCATLHLGEGSAVDLRGMLQDLRARHKVKRLLCEGGGQVFRSLLEAGLVNEIPHHALPAGLRRKGRAHPHRSGGAFPPIRDSGPPCKLGSGWGRMLPAVRSRLNGRALPNRP